ncbi:hypothetical protein [Paenibacillus sp. GYB003]|uniref:hypothetical protein n=1 Tax=Paenibacillus sp. GYB003 TaxID=2994392 RepID=UPI002F96D594
METLVGLWSASAARGAGTGTGMGTEDADAVEDAAVVFLADGAGWIEYSYRTLLELETFRWKLDAAGKLQLHGVTSYAKHGEERPSDVRLRDVGFAIAREKLPLGQAVDVVTFSRPLWGNEIRFGLVRTDVAREQLPQFDERGRRERASYGTVRSSFAGGLPGYAGSQEGA